MTLRLDGLVVRGEIDNTRPYSVCGWLKLRGHRAPLTLNLTGDCGPSLKGLRVRFEHPVPPDDREDAADAPDLSGLAWQQIGPTGVMALEPTGVGRPGRLTVEWFSQNGRVTLDLTDPVLETVADEEDEENETDDEAEADLAAMTAGDDDDDEDPYGLFPEELMEQFDSAAENLDREVLPAGDLPEPVGGGPSEVEMMEDLIENGEGVPVGSVFDPPIKLPRPDGLSDAESESALKTLLAKLAEHGISLDVCEHFTPAEAYELLIEEICPYELTHPDLEPTRWVQHFSTSDYCETCEAEFEREVEEYERNRGRDEDDED